MNPTEPMPSATDEELATLADLLARASPGVWQADWDGKELRLLDSAGAARTPLAGFVTPFRAGQSTAEMAAERTANAELAAAARNLLPRVLARLGLGEAAH